jgi:RNA polymerase sigma-70 factor (ECF subfamily)
MGQDGDPEPGAGPSGSGAIETDPPAEEFDDLRRRVTAAVRRHCPPRLAGQADDIVQNVLLKLLKVVRNSAGNRTFSSVYLEKSVCGAVVDEIRRACRRREDPVADDQTMDAFPSGTAGPEDGSASGEISRGIVDCLDRLIRPRKLAVTLYLHGCTVPEASGRLGWTLRKTESLVYRGLADLRSCLEKKGLKP